MVGKWRDGGNGEEVEGWWGSGGVVGTVSHNSSTSSLRKWRNGGDSEEVD